MSPISWPVSIVSSDPYVDYVYDPYVYVAPTAGQLRGFVIPAGTRIYYGGVAGGADTATQIFVDDASLLIPYP